MPCIYFISSIINSIIPQSLYHFHLDSYSISCSPIRIKHIADFIYPSIPQVSSILIGDFIFSLFVYIDNAKLILKGYVASSSEMATRRVSVGRPALVHERGGSLALVSEASNDVASPRLPRHSQRNVQIFCPG